MFGTTSFPVNRLTARYGLLPYIIEVERHQVSSMSRKNILVAYGTAELQCEYSTAFACLSELYAISEVIGFRDAAAKLRAGEFDVCIAVGGAVYEIVSFSKQRAGTPVVWVLSDAAMNDLHDSDELTGALGCWNTEELSPRLVAQAVPLLFELQELQRQIELPLSKGEQRELDEEIKALLSWYYRTTVTPDALGTDAMRELQPDQFAHFVLSLSAIVDRAIEERTFKVAPTTSRQLHDLSQQLALLNAGPRDIIDLYATALRSKAGSGSYGKGRAYVDASRALLLELMGYMVTQYRNLSRLAAWRSSGSGPLKPGE